MKKAVVVGGAGFIGSHLTDALLDEGYEVHVIDDLSEGKRENINENATFHEMDMRYYDDIAPVIEGAEFVFHLAAKPRVQVSIQDPLGTNDININGTLNVLRAAQQGGVKRVIYSASSSVYGDQDTMPVVETMLPNPMSPYGVQKHVGELYARAFNMSYGIETVCLRYFNVFGPRQDPAGSYAAVIVKFLRYARDNEPMVITGDGTQTRDFTYITDVVRANMLAATSDKVGKGESINIGAGEGMTINDLAKIIGGPVEHVEARNEPHDSRADNSLAKELLGWVPEVTVEDGIEILRKEK